MIPLFKNYVHSLAIIQLLYAPADLPHFIVYANQLKLYPNRENSMIELSFKMEMAKFLLFHQHVIPYKYCVFTPLTTDVSIAEAQAPWEMIYSNAIGISSSFANRTLIIGDMAYQRSMLI